MKYCKLPNKQRSSVTYKQLFECNIWSALQAIEVDFMQYTTILVYLLKSIVVSCEKNILLVIKTQKYTVQIFIIINFLLALLLIFLLILF